MPLRDFVGRTHKSSGRDYLARVTEVDKAQMAEVSCKFGMEYWDGTRHEGYGGYTYRGHHRPIAKAMIETYGLKPGMRVLDVGCGKGFLLHDFLEACPGLIVSGLDISDYAINSPDVPATVREFLVHGDAGRGLPWASKRFDLVVSINTLHNLFIDGLEIALKEIERVSRGSRYVCVEAYQTERQKVNLLYWQLTCRIFHTPAEWLKEFADASYTGDYEFIYFD